MKSTEIKFRTSLRGDGKPASFIEIPQEVMAVFNGRIRVKVAAKLNGFAYRTTIFSMGDCIGIPVRKEIREKAGLEFGKTIDVVLEEDLKERVMKIPADLANELKTSGLTSVFRKLSYTRQKESIQSIESAKTPETRKRRIEKVINSL